MTTNRKIFPLRLPQNYHGRQPQNKPLSRQYFEKLQNRQHIQNTKYVPSKWQRKITNKDIMSQRRQFIVHPACDNPEWVKSTYHNFHRSEYLPHRKQTRQQRQSYDVMNRRKVDPFSQTTQSNFTPSLSKFSINNMQITGKIGGFDRTNGFLRRDPEVSPKVGSVQSRDYSIKKPQLKIGQTHNHNFIDTYSVN